MSSNGFHVCNFKFPLLWHLQKQVSQYVSLHALPVPLGANKTDTNIGEPSNKWVWNTNRNRKTLQQQKKETLTDSTCGLIFAFHTDIKRDSMVLCFFSMVVQFIATFIAKHFIALLAPFGQDSVRTIQTFVGKFHVGKRQFDFKPDIDVLLHQYFWFDPYRLLGFWVVPIWFFSDRINVFHDHCSVLFNQQTSCLTFPPSFL